MSQDTDKIFVVVGTNSCGKLYIKKNQKQVEQAYTTILGIDDIFNIALSRIINALYQCSCRQCYLCDNDNIANVLIKNIKKIKQ